MTRFSFFERLKQNALDVYNDAFLDIAFTNLAREPAETDCDKSDDDFVLLRPSVTYIELFEVLSEHYSDLFPFVNDLMPLIYAMVDEEE